MYGNIGFESNENTYDYPRLLTNEEIAEILEDVINPYALDERSRVALSHSIYENIIYQLRQIHVQPSRIHELRNKIADAYSEAIVAPGRPAGSGAGASICAIITQMTLNTFHTAGSAKSADKDVKKTRSLIYASEKSSADIVIVHLENKKLSFEEVLNFRSQVEGLFVSNFVVNYSIEEYKYTWWYGQFIKRMQNEGLFTLPDYIPVVLKLKINLEACHSYSTEIAEIASSLMRVKIKDSSERTFIAVPSPTPIGEIHIIPIPAAIVTVLSTIQIKGDPELLPHLYLQIAVVKSLHTVRVKGINGITMFSPVGIPLLSMIENGSEAPLRDNMMFRMDQQQIDKLMRYERVFRADINNSVCLENGLTMGDDFRSLLFKCGLRLIKLFDDDPLHNDYIFEDRYIFITSDYVNYDKIIQIEQSGSDDSVLDPKSEETRILELSTRVREYTPAAIVGVFVKQRHSKSGSKIPHIEGNYYYGEAYGRNLQAILGIEGVDRKRTRCTNIRSMFEAFGIEAARQNHVLEIYKSISSTGSYVTQTHIEVMTESMVVKGTPYGVNFSGISRQNGNSHIELASVERAQRVFSDIAGRGGHEEIRKTSSAIATGTRIVQGTGCVDIVVMNSKGGISLFNDEILQDRPQQESNEIQINVNVEVFNKEFEAQLEVDEFKEVDDNDDNAISDDNNAAYNKRGELNETEIYITLGRDNMIVSLPNYGSAKLTIFDLFKQQEEYGSDEDQPTTALTQQQPTEEDIL